MSSQLSLVRYALLTFSPVLSATVVIFNVTMPSLTVKSPISHIPVSGSKVPLVVVCFTYLRPDGNLSYILTFLAVSGPKFCVVTIQVTSSPRLMFSLSASLSNSSWALDSWSCVLSLSRLSISSETFNVSSWLSLVISFAETQVRDNAKMRNITIMPIFLK